METIEQAISGVIQQSLAQQHYRLRRYLPQSNKVHLVVDQYWIVDWDLQGQEAHTQHNLPDPNMHLVIDHQRAYICTTITHSYQHEMKEQGRIIGVKFQPGVLTPRLKQKQLPILDCCIDAQELFPNIQTEDYHKLHALDSDREIVMTLENLLPNIEINPDVVEIKNIVEQAKSAEPGCKLNELARSCQIHPRRLQRLSKTYLGLSPKSLLQKFRLQKAVDTFDKGEKNPSKVALDLGFSDQAHLNREIKKHSNKTPREISTNR